jgi:hypothetical protein
VTLEPEDAATLIEQTRSENTVLIGGQAVAFWSAYFRVPTRLPGLTVDIDFLGTRREAQLADKRLRFPHTLKLGTLEDAPNTALLSVNLPGYEEPILIDYLAGVIGVDSNEIAKTAVTVEVHGEPLKVIHPLQLLKSKIWNLYALQSKRSAAGIEQARLSIEVVACFLRAARLTKRETLKAIEVLGRFAATDPARYAREHYRLDCLGAVPVELIDGEALPPAFREKRWPQIVARAK